jgi:hypothetical protein
MWHLKMAGASIRRSLEVVVSLMFCILDIHVC